MNTRTITVLSLLLSSSAITCSDSSSSNMPPTSNIVMARGGHYEMQEPITLRYNRPNSKPADNTLIEIIPHDDERRDNPDPKRITIRYRSSSWFYSDYVLKHSTKKCSLTSGALAGDFSSSTDAELDSYTKALQSAKTKWSANTATLRQHFLATRIPNDPNVTAEFFPSKLVVVHGSSHVTVHPCKFIPQEMESDVCPLCSIS